MGLPVGEDPIPIRTLEQARQGCHVCDQAGAGVCLSCGLSYCRIHGSWRLCTPCWRSTTIALMFAGVLGTMWHLAR
jgi:hypothetical protein